MDASGTCDMLVNSIKASNLNYRLTETPYKICITICKSFVQRWDASASASTLPDLELVSFFTPEQQVNIKSESSSKPDTAKPAHSNTVGADPDDKRQDAPSLDPNSNPYYPINTVKQVFTPSFPTKQVFTPASIKTTVPLTKIVLTETLPTKITPPTESNPTKISYAETTPTKNLTTETIPTNTSPSASPTETSPTKTMSGDIPTIPLSVAYPAVSSRDVELTRAKVREEERKQGRKQGRKQERKQEGKQETKQEQPIQLHNKILARMMDNRGSRRPQPPTPPPPPPQQKTAGKPAPHADQR